MSVRVSIIIPVYNAGGRLAGCLESVLGQSEQSLEILCINDGSTDGSAHILDAFARRDGRVRVITTENRGVWAARNEGLDNASGQYIVFCDADDVLPKNACAILASAADRGFDAVVGKHVLLDSRGAERKSWDIPCYTEAIRFLQHNTVWARIFRRSFLNENSLRFENFVLGEDEIFMMRCCLADPKWRMIDDIVYQYWWEDADETSLTHRLGLGYFSDHIRCRTALIALARENGFDDETVLTLASPQYLRGQLLRIRDGREAEEAMALLKQYLISLPWSKNPSLFEETMHMPAECFFSATAAEYILRCNRDGWPRTIDTFAAGEAGLRTLARCARAWFLFKLHRRNPDTGASCARR